jgi:hypothetical protein
VEALELHWNMCRLSLGSSTGATAAADLSRGALWSSKLAADSIGACCLDEFSKNGYAAPKLDPRTACDICALAPPPPLVAEKEGPAGVRRRRGQAHDGHAHAPGRHLD